MVNKEIQDGDSMKLLFWVNFLNNDRLIAVILNVKILSRLYAYHFSYIYLKCHGMHVINDNQSCDCALDST